VCVECVRVGCFLDESVVYSSIASACAGLPGKVLRGLGVAITLESRAAARRRAAGRPWNEGLTLCLRTGKGYDKGTSPAWEARP
jgi:hypothetical protein